MGQITISGIYHGSAVVMAAGHVLFFSVLLLNLSRFLSSSGQQFDSNRFYSDLAFRFSNSVSPKANFPLKNQLLSTPKYVGHLVSSPRGRTYHGSRTCYCANTDSSFQQSHLLTSGNVSLNPGPGYGSDTSASNGKKGRTARKSPTWKYP